VEEEKMTQEQLWGMKLHDAVMVAVDGSECSEAALVQGITIARGCQCKLFVIYVVNVNPEYFALSPAMEDKMEEEAMAVLEKAKARATAEQVDCETILSFDDQAYGPIVEEAKNRGISLIVVGSHGRTGLGRILMGSVSQRVVGHAPCPVLVIPSKRDAS
jgi:nucleotide-binding universal stress UspA family protein